jgi:hypothetical protein
MKANKETTSFDGLVVDWETVQVTVGLRLAPTAITTCNQQLEGTPAVATRPKRLPFDLLSNNIRCLVKPQLSSGFVVGTYLSVRFGLFSRGRFHEDGWSLTAMLAHLIGLRRIGHPKNHRLRFLKFQI